MGDGLDDTLTALDDSMNFNLVRHYDSAQCRHTAVAQEFSVDFSILRHCDFAKATTMDSMESSFLRGLMRGKMDIMPIILGVLHSSMDTSVYEDDQSRRRNGDVCDSDSDIIVPSTVEETIVIGSEEVRIRPTLDDDISDPSLPPPHYDSGVEMDKGELPDTVVRRQSWQ